MFGGLLKTPKNPGVVCYGSSRGDAIAQAKNFTLSIFAERAEVTLKKVMFVGSAAAEVKADQWMQDNPSSETNLEELEESARMHKGILKVEWDVWTDGIEPDQNLKVGDLND